MDFWSPDEEEEFRERISKIGMWGKVKVKAGVQLLLQIAPYSLGPFLEVLCVRLPYIRYLVNKNPRKGIDGA